MKKLLSLFMIAGAVVTLVPSHANAQAVEQGNILITPQYGYPNLFNIVIKNVYNESSYTGLDIGGIGPVGLQAEYMVADKIGFGIKANYSSTSISYTESTYDYKVTFNRIRVLPRFAYHFGNSSNFDGYFGVAAGYSSFKLAYESTDPYYTGDVAISNPIPVGFRVDVGGTYFFNDFIGLNFELGLGGGPVLNGGVTIKI